MCVMSFNEIIKLAVSVLSFQ